MRTFGLLCCLVLAAVLPARSTTTVTADGVWWNGLGESAQVTAVQAGLSSFQAGFESGTIAAMQYVIAAHVRPTATTYATINDELGPRCSKTFGLYVSEITDYYTRNPEKMNTPIGTMMFCLADGAPSCDVFNK
jgi:hypothetical protein